MAQPKHVVVVGGGIASLQLVTDLAKVAQLTLTMIDKKDYYENPLGTPRALVNRDFAARIRKAHASWMPKNAKLIVGTVRVVNKDKSLLVDLNQGGEQLVQFDYLVFVTGTHYNLFKTTTPTAPVRVQELDTLRDKIVASNNIVVVGGGPVGVEVIGEISHTHPNKKLTLVHSADRLLNRCPQKVSVATEAYLKSRGVNVILNDSIGSAPAASDEKKQEQKEVVVEKKALKTRKGVELACDLLLTATGATPNTQALVQHLNDALAPRSLKVQVTPTFQVVNYPWMFALGDVADLKEEASAANAKNHIPVVVANLTSLVQGKNPSATYTKPGFDYTPLNMAGPEYGNLCINICCCQPLFEGPRWANMKLDYLLALPADVK